MVPIKLTKTDILCSVTNLVSLTYANETVCGKSIHTPTVINVFARLFDYFRYRIKNVGDRFGVGTPTNPRMCCRFTLLSQSPDGATSLICL